MAMIADPQAGPRERVRAPGRGIAFALAVLVHLAFLGVLIFSIRWQSHAPEPVSAELYAPIATLPSPRTTPLPAPKVEPAPPVANPTPPPEPVVAKPEPAPPPKPVAVPDRPDPQAADIALKARAEAERKQRVEALRLAQEEEQKRVADIARQRELQKQVDDRKRADEKKAADARERQQREMTQMQAQADKELQARAQAANTARTKSTADAASKSAMDDWIKRIQAKVRGNVLIPPDMNGNPEAIFEVVQLPTGEIIDAQLRKSSGVPAYDDAVQRAIIKSSPLPKPDRPEMFQRVLKLQFRPSD